jgi:hypothetical protein
MSRRKTRFGTISNKQYPAANKHWKAATTAAMEEIEVQPTTKFIQRNFKPKTKNRSQNQPKNQQQNRSRRSNEKQRLRREKRCFYCKEVGHYKRNCLKKGRGYRSAKTMRIHQDEPTTLREYMARKPSTKLATAAINNSGKMVVTFKCGNKYH